MSERFGCGTGGRVWRRVVVAAIVPLLVVTGCGGGETQGSTAESGPADPAPSTTAVARPLRIVVTNDDGVASPGLDQLVVALAALPDVEVSVVAPLENQSGTSDRTTEGGAASEPASTASGVAATAVAGFPADSVIVAVDELGLEPDLVVSGVNAGQNVGPVAALSGTVGAARTAARLGVPAVAASAGVAYDPGQVGVAVDLVVAWVEANRAQLVAGTLPPEVISINVPTCAPDEMGDVVDVPLGVSIPEGVNIFASSCAAAASPADDVAAMVEGFPSRTRVPVELGSPVG